MYPLIHVAVYLSLYVFDESISPFVYLSMYPFIHVSVYLSLYAFYESISPFVYLSMYLSIYLFATADLTNLTINYNFHTHLTDWIIDMNWIYVQGLPCDKILNGRRREGGGGKLLFDCVNLNLSLIVIGSVTSLRRLMSVGRCFVWLDGRSVKVKCRKLHVHDPIGALVKFYLLKYLT